jgi:NitT/TauT family transport system substrate-binding protein
MTRFYGRLRTIAALAGLFLAATFSGAQSGNPVLASVGILKGPSGIGAAWLVSDPPQTSDIAFRFLFAGSADVVTAKLVSGEIIACVLPVNVAAKLYNAGVPLRALAVVGNGMVRFLTTDPSILGLKDIAGKEIQVAGQKATPDYLFRFLASRTGLAAGKDYTVSYNLQYPEAALALATGKIKSAVLPEPFATQARQLSGDIREAFDLGSLWTSASGRADYPMSLFVVSAAFETAHPEAVKKLGDAYRASIAKTIRDPQGTAQLAESLDLGIKAAVALQAIPRSAYAYADAQFSRPEIEAMLALFLSFDPQSIGGRLPDGQFYGK